jgi:AraC family transcriptional regulator
MVWNLPGMTVGLERREFLRELSISPGETHIVSFNVSNPHAHIRACYVGDSWTTAYREIGRVSYLPAGVGLHAIGEQTGGTLLMCRFEAGPLGQALGRFSEPDVDRLMACVNIRHYDIVHTLGRLADECRRPGLASDHLIENLMGMLAVDLARKIQSKCLSLSDSCDLARVEEYLIPRLHTQPSRSEVARAVGKTPRRFGTEFQASAGRTFSEFVAELRIRVARQLLETTSIPIKEVAFRSGFRHVSSFTTAFQNASGETPGQYRRRREAAWPLGRSIVVPQQA